MNKHRKQLLSLLLALLLFASLSVPALAASGINNQIKSGPASGASSGASSSNSSSSMRSLFNKASNHSKVKTPNNDDYFSDYFTMYADAPAGHSIKAFDHWVTDTNSLLGYIYHGSRVYVLAEHGDSYCVLYYTESNKLNVAWVPIERLRFDYPGRVFRLGSQSSSSGVANVGDPGVAWSKDNFVGTKTKYTLLTDPLENCVGFTLDYQLVTKSASQNEVLGPRAVYINDGSGWEYIGSFDYDAQGPCHVEIYLTRPMNLMAVATVADCDAPYGFTYRQSLIDALAK
ncbi:MAG: hypothetical protein K6F56_04465 [Oscillospiraceae bacterium]|nr:hypothetical protein [Oscillospiraceae bacterium]